METSAIPFAGRSGRQRPGPSNVIPFLAAPRRDGSSSLQLAAALRRLHKAGLRGGFVLVVPMSGDPESGAAHRAVTWWSRLCDRIRERTRLRVALMDVSEGAGMASSVADETLRRAYMIDEVTPAERSALIELSRGVCTAHPHLLAEARATAVSAVRPDELDAALRNGTLSGLFAHPITASLPIPA
ncbi:MAG: hypothetical protein F4139_08000 [Gemmatimonadetes bacterium]|nr:hypothetical protein [Gemmatimonadota bacterium]MYH52878.1 hypothetical protein [Gemmatimonadota bacterium]MYK66372.1 hypothetical protein [Gemmatimonadota bacterium]